MTELLNYGPEKKSWTQLPVLGHGLSLGSLSVLFFLVVVSPDLALGQEPSTSGSKENSPLWYGVIETPMAHLRTVLKQNTNGQQPPGWLLSPDQTSKEFPLDKLDITAEKLIFECRSLGAKYSGVAKKSGVFDGKFKQSGGQFRLKMSQVEKMPSTEAKKIWRGTLKAGPRELELQFRIFDSPDSSDYVVFDSLNQGVKGLHAVRETDGAQLIIRIPGLQAEFIGTLSESERQVEGVWKQGGAEFPFKMVAGSKSDAKPKRPQAPKAPFPYQIIEVSFPGGADGVTLAGTLTIPKSKSKDSGLPVAILVSGSGPQDRDETILDHKPFAVLADYLGRHGIAVLRYDDRGVAKSTGDFNPATTQDFARDAWAAASFLQDYDKEAFGSIGIIGHSEGGMVGPIVAANHPADIAFVVMLAGPGVVGSEIIESQTQLLLAAAGADDAALEQAERVSNALLSVLAQANTDFSYQDLIKQVADRLFTDLTPEQRVDFFDPEKGETPSDQLNQEIKSGLRPAATPWYQYFISYDPLPTLKQVQCPVLALNGERDLQVDPKLNLPVIKNALQNPKSRTMEIQGLNHLFQPCKTGSMDEYFSIEVTIDPNVLKIVSDWILSI